jgi:hypothetical protein
MNISKSTAILVGAGLLLTGFIVGRQELGTSAVSKSEETCRRVLVKQEPLLEIHPEALKKAVARCLERMDRASTR